MIVEIEKPQPSCQGALDYNERKVAHGVAFLVASGNIDTSSLDSIYGTFERYSHGVYDVQQVSFHASVNPAEDDTSTEEQVIAFIEDMLVHLGYGEQPYLIYRHQDIERAHYHVVTSRVDATGHKIPNLYEKKTVSAFMRAHAQEYGFKVAQKRQTVTDADDICHDDSHSLKIQFFNPEQEVSSQLSDIYDVALTYDFRNFEQLRCILEYMGVRAEISKVGLEQKIALQGLDKKGIPTTEKFTHAKLGKNLAEMMHKTLNNLSKNRRYKARTASKARTQSIVSSAFHYSKSESHFVNILRNKGISMHKHVSEDTGEIFGVTFIDHRSRVVHKASELGQYFSLAEMKDAVDSGKWRPNDKGDRGRGDYVKKTRQNSSRRAAILSGRFSGAARLFRNSSQPRGSSWSGKADKTDLQKETERNQEKSGSLHPKF